MRALDERIARLRRKLAAVPKVASLIAGGHGSAEALELRRPVSEQWLTTLEAQWHIRLPAAYRAFLREVGEAGAGPYHGLLPTYQWDDLDEIEPARPFPVGPDHRYAGEDWWREFGWQDEGEAVWPGMLTVGHLGCGDLVGLVVTGPAAGRVVYTSDAGPPYFPPYADFVAWYEGWLDEVICGVLTGAWFGRWPVRPDEMVREVVDAGIDPVRRARIALQLSNLEGGDEPPDRVLPALTRATADEAAVVRAAALCSLGRRADQQAAVAEAVAGEQNPWVAEIARLSLGTGSASSSSREAGAEARVRRDEPKVRPVRQSASQGDDRRWADADRIVETAYRAVRPAARRLRLRMQLQQYTGYEFVEIAGVTPVSEDTYLVTKVITTPDADYPTVRRFDPVTPGYTWHLRRTTELGDDTVAEAATIALSVNDRGVAQLRCGDQVRPATGRDWTELATTVLEPWSSRTRHGLFGFLRILLAPLPIAMVMLYVFWPVVLIGGIAFLLTRCG
ncbi:hypothetical protein Kfla_4462 [Kribbella flavida DSM 17836]|uniref:Knr4/Smi1-like domain-containing protein n=1 Tax=Kribbella flavida (strain DSM 17836 / JCM 10339 / NBRC 14399) TaxID=479435 RepID=D2PWM3_KRIFD|nr:SMI1/KNR4 family protein [Kribbella flavida]ADB33492.1 hypothetical protein Kfla_4462 [Kribbella flavida DSM 17836]